MVEIKESKSSDTIIMHVMRTQFDLGLEYVLVPVQGQSMVTSGLPKCLSTRCPHHWGTKSVKYPDQGVP